MSTHPYKQLPDKAFWRRSLAGKPAAEVDPVGAFTLRIGPHTKVATAGSCFAQHIARHLHSAGFNYYVAEQGHPILPRAVRKEQNYELFSARYGNVYTARQLWQLLRRAYGEFSPAEEAWVESDGSVKDPFRPSIQPGGFVSVEEMEADRRQHLAAVREMFETLDVFVFTLGLTECWLSRVDGAVFPLCPGVEGGVFDAQKYTFCNQTVEDVVADMSAFLDRLATINRTAKVVLTVSPVPLMATAEPDAHVLAATTYSKAVLRVAAETLCKRYQQVHYFPSYEIITGSFNRGRYYSDDLRNVTEEGVAHVMRLFLQHATTTAPDANPSEKAGASDDHFLATAAAVLQVECDEVALDREEAVASVGPPILDGAETPSTESSSAENPPSTSDEGAALPSENSPPADALISQAWEAVNGTTPAGGVIAELETLKVRAFHTELRSTILEAELAAVAKRLARSDAELIIRGAERQVGEEQRSSGRGELNTAIETLTAEHAALKAERAALKEQRDKQQALAKTFNETKLKVKELGARVTAEKQASAGLKHALNESRADLEKTRQKLAGLGLDVSVLEKSNAWSALRVVLKAEADLRRSYRRIGRVIRKTPSKDVEHAKLIVQSKYFDAAWYKSQYLDGAETELEAALHYLRTGAPQGHDPGPRFSSSYYLQEHKDVAQAGFNPLVHYIKFGEGEARSIHRGDDEPFELPLPSRARSKPSASRAEPEVARPSYRFEAPLAALVPVRYPRQRVWTETPAQPEAAPEGAVPLLLSGVELGWLRQFADAVPLELEPVRAFSVLSGVDPAHALQFDAQSQGATNLAPTGSYTPPAAGLVLALGAAAGCEFADVWFLNECDLRARLRATPDRPDAPRLLRCYQYDPSGERGLVLLCESRIPLGELGLIDVTTQNPYCPLLFALSTQSGEVLSVSLLPFPSLCRGGSHYGELLAIASDDAYLEALRNVSRLLLEKRLPSGLSPRPVRIEVDLTTATGAERIFTTHLRQWLMRCLNVELASAGPASSKKDDSRAYLEAAVCTPALADAGAQPELVLSLPADALPSLTVLLAPQVRQSDSSRAFVIADRVSGSPKWLVSPPHVEPSLCTLQPPGRGFPSSTNAKPSDELLGEQAMSAPAWPLAIRFCDLSDRDPARLITPFAREKSEALLPETRFTNEARVSVLYHPSGIPGTAGNLDAFLESLRLQDRVSVLELVVLLPEVDHQALSAARVLLGRHLGSKGRVVPYASGSGYGARLNDVAAVAQGELLLVADGGIILHDQRTLATLAGLAQHERTAAASCMLLQRAERPTSTPVRFQSAGFFPVADPHTDVGRAGLLRAAAHPGQLPPATWPVAATSSQLLMVRADTWRTIGGFGSEVARKESDIEYGLRTAAQGYFHFCTSVVTASFLHEAHPSETKPVRLEAEEFAAATRAGTLLRSLVT